MSNEQSPISSDKQTLDKNKLVYLTNRAQAICLCLSMDELVPKEAQEYYKQANEMMIKAMHAVVR
jgi:hypothetical protein